MVGTAHHRHAGTRSKELTVTPDNFATTRPYRATVGGLPRAGPGDPRW
jgi:hypothetical protein